MSDGQGTSQRDRALALALAAVGGVGVVLVATAGLTFARSLVDLGALAVTAYDDQSRKSSSIAFAISFSSDSGLRTIVGGVLIGFAARSHRRRWSPHLGFAVITILLIAVAGLWVIGSPRRVAATAVGLALAAEVVLIRCRIRSTNRVGVAELSP